MSTQPPVTTNNQAPAKAPLVPPEERFWQHSSPHHEAPLAGVGSFTLHGLAAALAVVIGIIASFLGLGHRQQSLPVETVQLDAGGGGNPEGKGDGRGEGSTSEAATPEGTATNPEPKEPTPQVRPTLKDPT